MVKRLLQIWEGWRNKYFPPLKLRLLIFYTAKKRMEICNRCKHNSNNAKGYKTLRPDVHCLICKCTLSAKTKCLSCECPLSMWRSVIP